MLLGIMYRETTFKQKCIPIGCVLPACWLYAVVSDEGVCRPLFWGRPPLMEADPPLDSDMWPEMHAEKPSQHPRPPPPPREQINRMTHGCENITVLQTSFAGGNYVVSFDSPHTNSSSW